MAGAPMIVLFTDFGSGGPYVGQIKAVLHREAPASAVVDLFADAPAFEPQLAAYLLPAYAAEFPAGAVFLCVVDPGVGGARAPLLLQADGRWFTGPDNGLFQLVARRAGRARCWEIGWRPARLSASFHGRDLFAPVAAALARGGEPADPDIAGGERPAGGIGDDWPDELPRIVYVDHFGNAMTGIRARMLDPAAMLEVAGRGLPRRQTFSEAPAGTAFWYENANGLAEIAVNRGRADRLLGLEPGTPVTVLS